MPIYWESLKYENKNANVFIFIFEIAETGLDRGMKRTRSRKGAPGIVEVASRAGVSAATVSRFYNDPDIVRGPTRVRIEQAASELGYIRDRMAGSLHNRFTGTFGLVVPTIDNAIFSEMIEAFAGQLRAHDRTMLIASHGYDLSLEVPIIRSLLERRIDGVAMVGLDHDETCMTMLASRDVPVISVWNHSPDASLPSIGVDNHAVAARATRYLLDLGHRDIAFLFPQTESNDRARARKAGAVDCMKEAGIDVPDHRMMMTSYNISEAKSAVRTVLQNDPPTAILCGNDIIAQGAIYAAQSLNISVPGSLSVVGIGDFAGSADIEPGLTTVRIPARRIGREAANMIVEMSNSGRVHTIHTEMETHLIERGSAGPCPA